MVTEITLITIQRETTVVWDGDSGRPLHNAIVWLDTRTQVSKLQVDTRGFVDFDSGIPPDYMKKYCLKHP